MVLSELELGDLVCLNLTLNRCEENYTIALYLGPDFAPLHCGVLDESGYYVLPIEAIIRSVSLFKDAKG